MSQRTDGPDAAAGAARAGTWKLDSSTADIRFTARELWQSFRFSGRFPRARGSIVWGEDKTGAVLMELHAAGISTGLRARDNRLCAPGFLDVANHPLITFRGNAIRPNPARLEIVGKLVVRDIATALDLDVDLAPAGNRIAAATTARIDLSAYDFAEPHGMLHLHADLLISGSFIPLRRQI
ncbi:YceI-like domain-containing protein [Nocardia amikacinitolerans]|uniref:YceI family protein n=1 Tax=Nocardia amikacinitolerans TaxID=756689 RepID=UPI0008317B0C|nr:YceI family protein [Nocardia amikacinitolerans]MCP2315978.1 YceI-like domain-containing protein [Nocardia amikacinitolerans]